ncbi:SRPBCC family protein [Microbacterium sp. 179-I 3D4 NHS]|uniref:SRPBCC family protein n=1 Tax=Microbacterium sp. 179-I 3D4 NHS TaxID=3142381 RepID=UPI0039A2BF33
MAENRRRMACDRESVFRVLADGWLYPVWVVGASRMREVDENWPAAGSKLHHSFGVWPVLIDDSTSVLEWDPPRRAVLQARGWPIGEARVTIEAATREDGCEVRIIEHPATGPATLIPSFLIDPMLKWRNSETLRRLAYVAERRWDEA